MPGPVVGRQLAETGNAPLPAVDLGGQRGGVGTVGGDGKLPVLGGGARARHLADAAAKGLGPGLLIRSADAGLPLIRRHRPEVRLRRAGDGHVAAVGENSRRETWWRIGGDDQETMSLRVELLQAVFSQVK